MKNYIGCKIIKAKKATYGEYRSERYGTKSFESAIKNSEPGYLVVYPNPDGTTHTSWSPAAVFEITYREVLAGEISLVNE